MSFQGQYNCPSGLFPVFPSQVITNFRVLSYYSIYMPDKDISCFAIIIFNDNRCRLGRILSGACVNVFATEVCHKKLPKVSLPLA